MQCVDAYQEWEEKSTSGECDEEVIELSNNLNTFLVSSRRFGITFESQIDEDTIALALRALVAQVGIYLDKVENFYC